MTVFALLASFLLPYVDSYIGKLRAVFKDAGREGDWNTAFALGNPAASAEV